MIFHMNTHPGDRFFFYRCMRDSNFLVKVIWSRDVNKHFISTGGWKNYHMSIKITSLTKIARSTETGSPFRDFDHFLKGLIYSISRHRSDSQVFALKFVACYTIWSWFTGIPLSEGVDCPVTWIGFHFFTSTFTTLWLKQSGKWWEMKTFLTLLFIFTRFNKPFDVV